MGKKSMGELFRVKTKGRFRLEDCDPGWDRIQEIRGMGGDDVGNKARSFMEKSLKTLAEAQELLWASDTCSILMVLQAMDAAGKDGVIKHVMSGVNPQGCQVFSFKAPSAEELDHTFLWRCMKALPERGRIGIFNRSHYEEVLVVRVHPELLERQKLPPGRRGGSFWKERYEDINAFERHLVRNGTVVVKFFLHLSKGEQKERFLARLRDPRKQWKFSHADLEERELWDDYQKAYDDAIRATSTPWAPWYVIPADRKWVARAAVAGILVDTIRSMRLSFPAVGEEQRRELGRAEKQLAGE
ncbi:MAG: polyphosphate kinase 2 family protein [Acidobacteria bacterium]|nr:polyphosphate kinase 2 family protein [Acidobacteriota bacterium]